MRKGMRSRVGPSEFFQLPGGQYSDGYAEAVSSTVGVLVDEALGQAQGVPLLAFNTLKTESERSEDAGLPNLCKGMFGAFRNPTAHEPRISWRIEEQDATDLLTLASLLHRRLDAAVSTRRAPPASP
jgi:uncharacterized protein (TIGR02391 family)